MTPSTNETVTLQFLRYLYVHDEGYICIATCRPPLRRDTFQEKYFEWPGEAQEIADYVEKVQSTHNVWFGVNVLSVPKRIKGNCIPQNLVWADLDSCSPELVEIPPQCVIESSPKRYQAIWKLDRKIDPLLAENYSKRIAYKYADYGADKTGHDLTQLLRMPGSFNFKYKMDDPPEVRLLANIEDELPTDVFESLPQPDGYVDVPDIAIPDLQSLPSYEMVFYAHQEGLKVKGLATAYARYVSEEPPSDWSGHLWRLLLLCFEAGMSAEETFVVAKNSKSNKYARDGRPDSHLWREILKAEMEHKTVETMLAEHRFLSMPLLITKAEEESLESCIIDDYHEWATDVTDAVPEFHEISCAMLLSTLMSTTLRLYTERPRPIVPNLWAMILGESTLTRKTTAMDMAMDFVLDIDRSLMLASDGSVEGLLSRLALRPKMVSVFYRDEISGFFDSMQRKDYLAGMHETMTKMYDVPQYTMRVLKKETYEIIEPIFIFFGGGVPGKMYSLIDESYFASGFIPRFLVVRGYGSTDNIRPTGPPRRIGMDKRAGLHSTFQALYSLYTDREVLVDMNDGQKMVITPEIQVRMDDPVWERMAVMERQLLQAAEDSPEAERALPMFSRMYVSIQKLTMLLAAARQEPTELQVKAEMRDLLKAAYYIQKWGRHAVDLVRNSGIGGDETKLLAVYRTIEKQPGLLRSEVMQAHRLNAREADAIESTLVQRAMIQVVAKSSRAKQYWPVGR